MVDDGVRKCRKTLGKWQTMMSNVSKQYRGKFRNILIAMKRMIHLRV